MKVFVFEAGKTYNIIKETMNGFDVLGTIQIIGRTSNKIETNLGKFKLGCSVLPGVGKSESFYVGNAPADSRKVLAGGM